MQFLKCLIYYRCTIEFEAHGIKDISSLTVPRLSILAPIIMQDFLI